MPKEDIIIFANDEQRLNHIDPEYQYWLQYWKKRFQEEIEEIDNEKNHNTPSE